MKQNNILEKIGLTSAQSALYTTLVKEGPKGISELAKSSGLTRPLIYRSLPGLTEQGLIEVLPRGKYKQYKAAPPGALEGMYQLLGDDLAEEIENLKEAGKKSKNKFSIRFIEGKAAIRAMMKELLLGMKTGETYYRYSSYSSSLTTTAKGYTPKDLRDIRDAKKLERLVITNQITKARKKPRLGRQVKIIPPSFDLFDYQINMGIYGDNVLIVDFNSDSATLLTSKKFATFQRRIFELLFSYL